MTAPRGTKSKSCPVCHAGRTVSCRAPRQVIRIKTKVICIGGQWLKVPHLARQLAAQQAHPIHQGTGQSGGNARQRRKARRALALRREAA